MFYNLDIVAVPGQAAVCLRRRRPLGENGARTRRLREIDAAGLVTEVCRPRTR